MKRRAFSVAGAWALFIGAAVMLTAVARTAGAREEATRQVVDSVEPAGKVASDLGFVGRDFHEFYFYIGEAF